jgi:hypothetical protein
MLRTSPPGININRHLPGRSTDERHTSKDREMPGAPLANDLRKIGHLKIPLEVRLTNLSLFSCKP